MKKLLSILLLLAAPAFAQVFQKTAPDCEFEFRFNVVGGVITSTTGLSATRLPLSGQGSGPSQTVVGFDNRAVGCSSWTITGQTQGVSTVSIELDQAPIAAGDAPGSYVTWTTPAPGTVFPITVTGTLQASAFGYNPWVSVLINSANGTGTVYGRVYGWRPQAGSDVTSPGNAVVTAGFTAKHISSNTNTQVKATPGVLHLVTVGTAAAGAITIVDTSAANCSGGTTISVVTAVANAAGTQYTLIYDVAFVNGLCITTAASPDITVSFR